MLDNDGTDMKLYQLIDIFNRERTTPKIATTDDIYLATGYPGLAAGWEIVRKDSLIAAILGAASTASLFATPENTLKIIAPINGKTITLYMETTNSFDSSANVGNLKQMIQDKVGEN